MLFAIAAFVALFFKVEIYWVVMVGMLMSIPLFLKVTTVIK